MADYFVKSGSGAIVLSNRAWSNGERMVPVRSDASTNFASARQWVWEVTTAGTSNGTPTWPAQGTVTQDSTTVTQNGVVWTARKPGFSSGSTVDWTFATIFLDYLVSATTVVAAGDTIYMSNNDAESYAATATYAFPGTLSSPNLILCVDDSVTSGFTAATTASITITVGNFATVVTGALYMAGVTWIHATTTNAQGIALHTRTDLPQVYEDCSFQLTGGSGTTRLTLGSTNNEAGGVMIWRNCTFKHATTAAGVIQINGVYWRWSGGSVLATSNVYSVLCRSATNVGRAYKIDIIGVDLSNIPSASNLTTTVDAGGSVVYRECKLPASWSGSPVNGTPTAGARVEMHDCDNANTNYRVAIDDWAGTIRSETSIVLTGGASAGTPVSIKMTANSSAKFWNTLRSQDIIFYLPAATTLSVTVEVIHSGIGSGTGGALTDAEAWVRVVYPGTSGFPLGVALMDRKATYLSAPADQASSTATWTNSPATPVKQKFVQSITTVEAGFCIVNIELAIAGILYADFKVN